MISARIVFLVGEDVMWTGCTVPFQPREQALRLVALGALPATVRDMQYAGSAPNRCTGGR
jgi:hypothetical protein